MSNVRLGVNTFWSFVLANVLLLALHLRFGLYDPSLSYSDTCDLRRYVFTHYWPLLIVWMSWALLAQVAFSSATLRFLSWLFPKKETAALTANNKKTPSASN